MILLGFIVIKCGRIEAVPIVIGRPLFPGVSAYYRL